jgi:hypothetical protein
MKLVLLLIATLTVAEKKTLSFECVPASTSDPEQVMTIELSNGTVARFPVCPPRMTLWNMPLDPIELGDMPVYEYYLPRFVPKSTAVVNEEEEVIPVEMNAVVQNYTKILENAVADINKRIDESDPWFVQSKRIAEQLQKDIELRQQMDRWLNEMRYVRPMPRLSRYVEIARRNKKMARNLSSVYRDEMCHKARRRILLHECME